MGERASRPPRRRRNPLWFLFERLPLEQETTVFILVSAFDVWMTAHLLTRSDIHFVEANPVARYFIYGWGLKGMVAFKFLLVAFVTVTAQVIARRRLETARRVLQFGIVVVTGVVIYSVLLLLRTTGGI